MTATAIPTVAQIPFAARLPAYLRWYKWLLLGYALFGRTFAYLGVAPLFVGEVFLFWGILRAPVARGISKLLSLPLFMLFLSFMALCTAVAAANMFKFPIVEVLRDSAIWGYGAFAVITASYFLRNPEVVPRLLKHYGQIAPFYIVVAPIMGVLTNYYLGRLPPLPGMNVTALELKPTDVLVHLSGILALVYLGFRRFSVVQLTVLSVSVLVLSALTRGGLAAFGCATLVIFFLKPRFKFICSFLGAIFIALAVFTFVDFDLKIFGRSISSAQIGRNVVSIFGGGGDPVDLGGTRQWRIEWWKDIVQYTFHGDYFWSGKGFGINLANDDGYQVDVDGERLRSPHNSNITFLARAGVPTFFLWLSLQFSWAIAMLRTILRAKASGHTYFEHLGIFLLAYWTSMFVNMNFDVYLEGPMGGIWFWTIFGLGMAMMWLYRYQRDSFGSPAGNSALRPLAIPLR